MKIDLENILYILAIVVWVVMGFIRKNKKKEKHPVTVMPPIGESTQPDISTVLQEIIRKNKQTVTPVNPSLKTKKKQVLETIPVSDYGERSIKNKPGIKKEILQNDIFVNEQNPLLHNLLETPDDLRRAVIVSEILNPKWK